MSQTHRNYFPQSWKSLHATFRSENQNLLYDSEMWHEIEFYSSDKQYLFVSISLLNKDKRVWNTNKSGQQLPWIQFPTKNEQVGQEEGLAWRLWITITVLCTAQLRPKFIVCKVTGKYATENYSMLFDTHSFPKCKMYAKWVLFSAFQKFSKIFRMEQYPLLAGIINKPVWRSWPVLLALASHPLLRLHF